jgi:hypothetical protein
VSDLTPKQKAERLALIRRVAERRSRPDADDEPTEDAVDEMLAPEAQVRAERRRIARELDGGRGAANREEFEASALDDGDVTISTAVMELDP